MPNHKISRRKFLCGSATAAGSVLLAACGAPAPTTSDTTEAAPTSQPESPPTEVVTTPPEPAGVSSEAGTLTFLGHANHPLDLIRDAFQKKYPDVKTDWVHVDDHGTRFQTAMAAGTGVPDLYWAEADMVQRFGDQNALLETDTVINKVKDQILPGKLKEAFVESRGHYYGMPGDLSVCGIYYQPDELQKLGIDIIPDDMQYDPDFLGILDKIAKAGKNATLYPAEGGGIAATYWNWFVNQLGGSGPTTGDNQAVTMDDEHGIAATTLLKKIYDTKAPLQAEFWSPEYWNAINTNQLVLELAPAWARGFWEKNISQDVIGKWRLAPMPRAKAGGPRTAVWGGATLISPAITQNKELALQFMEFAFGSMEGAQAAAEWGIIPPYLPYLEGPFQDLKFPLFGDQEAPKVWLELGKELSTTFSRTAAYGAANEILSTDLHNIITGEVAVESGMKQMADQLREVLPDYQVQS